MQPSHFSQSTVIDPLDSPQWGDWAGYGDRIGSEDDLLNYRLNSDLRTYREIEDDPYFGRLIEERRESPFRKPWTVEAASSKPADLLAAEIIRQFLTQIPFDKICADLNQAIMSGRAIVEMVGWDEQEYELKPKKTKIKRRVTVPSSIVPRDATRLVFARPSNDLAVQHYMGFECRQLTRSHPFQGVPLPVNSVIIHSHGSLVGNPYGKGVYRRLYWLNIFKNQVLKIGLPSLESKALPYLTYNGSASEEDISKAKQAVAQFYRLGWMSLPDGIAVSFLERFHQGRLQSIKEFLDWFDMQAATAIVGQTLTSKHQDSAGRGDSSVHYKVGEDRAKTDSDLLSESLREMLCKPLTLINVPGAKPPTIYRDFTPPIDTDKQSQVDERLARMGYRRTAESVVQIYGEGFEDISIDVADGDRDS